MRQGLASAMTWTGCTHCLPATDVSFLLFKWGCSWPTRRKSKGFNFEFVFINSGQCSILARQLCPGLCQPHAMHSPLHGAALLLLTDPTKGTKGPNPLSCPLSPAALPQHHDTHLCAFQILATPHWLSYPATTTKIYTWRYVSLPFFFFFFNNTRLSLLCCAHKTCTCFLVSYCVFSLWFWKAISIQAICHTCALEIQASTYCFKEDNAILLLFWVQSWRSETTFQTISQWLMLEFVSWYCLQWIKKLN